MINRCYSSSAGNNNDIALKKSLIEKKLEESGEKARLEEHLRQKLIECGWKDELKKYCLGKSSLTVHNFYRLDPQQGLREDQLGRLG